MAIGIEALEEAGSPGQGHALRSVGSTDECEPGGGSKSNTIDFNGKEDVMAKNQKLEVEVSEEPVTGDLAVEQLDRIRQRAYELYVARGQEDGHELEDWLQAEAEISAG